MKNFFIIFLILIFSSNAYADFKKIKKKATVTQPEVIFPIPKNLDNFAAGTAPPISNPQIKSGLKLFETFFAIFKAASHFISYFMSEIRVRPVRVLPKPINSSDDEGKVETTVLTFWLSKKPIDFIFFKIENSLLPYALK